MLPVPKPISANSPSVSTSTETQNHRDHVARILGPPSSDVSIVMRLYYIAIKSSQTPFSVTEHPDSQPTLLPVDSARFPT
jgi:hypothetical protein